MSALLDVEKLTSQFSDGEWHARYPSAARTLCGKQTATTARGRKWPPTCGVLFTDRASV